MINDQLSIIAVVALLLALPVWAEEGQSLSDKYKDATEEQLVEAFTRVASEFIQSSQTIELRQHTLTLSLRDKESSAQTEHTRELRAKVDALEIELARARQALSDAFDEVPKVKETRDEIARDAQTLEATRAERDYLRNRIATLRKARQ